MVSPCLDATYGVDGRWGPVDLRPYIEDTLIILPRPSRGPKSLKMRSIHIQVDFRHIERDVGSLLVDHHVQLFLLTPPDPEQVDVCNLSPFGVEHLMSHFPTAADPCVVDRDVEPAEFHDNLG